MCVCLKIYEFTIGGVQCTCVYLKICEFTIDGVQCMCVCLKICEFTAGWAWGWEEGGHRDLFPKIFHSNT